MIVWEEMYRTQKDTTRRERLRFNSYIYVLCTPTHDI